MAYWWCWGYSSELYSFTNGINSEYTVKSAVNFTTMKQMDIINYGVNHSRRGHHASRGLNKDVLFSTFCHDGNCFLVLCFSAHIQTDVWSPAQEIILRAIKFRKYNIYCYHFALLLLQWWTTVKHLPHKTTFMSYITHVSLSETNLQ